MTLTILASFSLLALVVTARPIVPHDDAEYAYARHSDVESAVQAVFESRNKQAALEGLDGLEGDIKIHITSPQDQRAYLSQLDTGDVKALIPLGDNGLLSEDEKKLYEMLGGSEAMDDVEGDSRPLDEVGTPKAVSLSVGGEVEVAEEEAVALPEPEAVTSVNAPWYAGPSQPLIVVAFSCALAFVTMLCVGVSLYAYYYVRTQLFSSRTAWDLLPRLEKQGLASRTAPNGMASTEKPLLEDEKLGLLRTFSRAASREQDGQDAGAERGNAPASAARADDGVCAARRAGRPDLFASYLRDQRNNFVAGLPAPDFPGGEGETKFVWRGTAEDAHGVEGRRMLGFEKFEISDGMTGAEKSLFEEANQVLA
ncbi:hypothetical protein EWM64_g6229 [Hericium alpestre]|uniref:Uncharacterized protein n=1 Tax=Hericium alpestre TaxID=135208 RepID=A0A4Y9ZSK9_9AGAM|nr:hypothetical protein EWM64_g6229 [Hericium alpestre]